MKNNNKWLLLVAVWACSASTELFPAQAALQAEGSGRFGGVTSALRGSWEWVKRYKWRLIAALVAGGLSLHAAKRHARTAIQRLEEEAARREQQESRMLEKLGEQQRTFLGDVARNLTASEERHRQTLAQGVADFKTTGLQLLTQQRNDLVALAKQMAGEYGREMNRLEKQVLEQSQRIEAAAENLKNDYESRAEQLKQELGTQNTVFHSMIADGLRQKFQEQMDRLESREKSFFSEQQAQIRDLQGVYAEQLADVKSKLDVMMMTNAELIDAGAQRTINDIARTITTLAKQVDAKTMQAAYAIGQVLQVHTQNLSMLNEHALQQQAGKPSPASVQSQTSVEDQID